MFGHETMQIAKIESVQILKLSHSALKTKARVGKVKYELLHIVLQVNQGKTSPLTFLTEIHAEKDDGMTL